MESTLSSRQRHYLGALHLRHPERPRTGQAILYGSKGRQWRPVEALLVDGGAFIADVLNHASMPLRLIATDGEFSTYATERSTGCEILIPRPTFRVWAANPLVHRAKLIWTFQFSGECAMIIEPLPAIIELRNHGRIPWMT